MTIFNRACLAYRKRAYKRDDYTPGCVAQPSASLSVVTDDLVILKNIHGELAKYEIKNGLLKFKPIDFDKLYSKGAG